MGFKKGRAARAQGAKVSLRTEGSRVIYEAANGFTYRIDVLDMVQVNTSKGSRRNVYRHQGHGKNWCMWQYELERAEGRNYTHSKMTLVQYPKEVCIALESCFRAARAELRQAEIEGPQAVDRQRAENEWRVQLADLQSKQLRDVFLVAADAKSAAEDQSATLAAEAAKDAALREVLLELALRQTKWPCAFVAETLRWLQRRGLHLEQGHVRKAALLHGGLTVLKVLLIEADVQVVGLELLVDHRCANLGQSTSGGGWVQRCKPALKALLARGAVLGSHSLQSRLLKRLEEDGQALWVARAVQGLRSGRPELPDPVLARIEDFARFGLRRW
ncbi:unnamed protein product [Effrenium voratum]|uniref:WWE domain-containing protein n=1 Tax=Effrenium voratum TaxID=2562239 RepID=A0AA36N3D7_9DINO|nr:unnamed protein product [Effrenium voratum]